MPANWFASNWISRVLEMLRAFLERGVCISPCPSCWSKSGVEYFWDIRNVFSQNWRATTMTKLISFILVLLTLPLWWGLAGYLVESFSGRAEGYAMWRSVVAIVTFLAFWVIFRVLQKSGSKNVPASEDKTGQWRLCLCGRESRCLHRSSWPPGNALGQTSRCGAKWHCGRRGGSPLAANWPIWIRDGSGERPGSRPRRSQRLLGHSCRDRRSYGPIQRYKFQTNSYSVSCWRAMRQ